VVRSAKRFVYPLGLCGLATLIAGSLVLVLVPNDDSATRDAQAAIAKRDFRSALRVLNDQLGREPGNLAARILAAETARRDCDYEQAAQHLRLYEQFDGPSMALELERRLLAVQLGDAAQAELVTEFCLAQPDAPESARALEALIVGDLEKLRRPMESPDPLLPGDSPPPERLRLLKMIEVWLDRQREITDQVQGLVWRGRARRLAGDHPGAVADLERVLEMDPEHFEARVYLAQSIAQDQPLESIAHFERLRQQRPNDIHLLYSIATASRSVGDQERARESLDQILRAQPNNSQVLLERARLAIDERELAEAKGYLDRVASIGPDSAELHWAFARYLKLVGKPDEAQRHQDQFENLNATQRQPVEH
jgi:tetratricopeptide (TPR) repeat protein